MYYVTGARPTRLDRKRKRQRNIGFACLIILALILIWGIVEYSTKQPDRPAQTEIEVQ